MTSFRCVAAVLMMVVCATASGQQRNINFDLLQAARSGSVGAVRTLLDEGANPNSRNRLGDTPLNTAARNGQIELVQLLIARGADVNLANLARVTPLMSAAYGGHAEIERVLIEHPAVAEAAAVAVRSEIAGGEDEVKACVVLTPGHALSPAALLDFCQTRMPHFAVPRYVEFLAALPKTPTAKVQKVTLRQSGITAATWDREAAGYRLRR